MKILRLLITIVMLGTLSMLSGAASNNPTVTLTPLSTNLSEGSGDVVITFRLSVSEAPNKNPIIINYTTVNGSAVAPTNYTAASGTKTFAVGDASDQIFTVLVHTNAVIAANVSFTVNISNGGTNPSQNFTLSNTTAAIAIIKIAAPTTVDDDVAVEINIPTTLYILGNDIAGSSPIDPASIVIGTDVTHGTTIVNATGDVTYTPDVNYTGTDSFTYTVEDVTGAVSAAATVNINVTYPIPIAYNKFYTVAPGGDITGNLIYDSPVNWNVAHNLVINSYTVPALGTLSTVTSGGDFNFTASGMADGDATTFTYSVKNDYNMTSNTATVTIYANTYCADAETILSTDTNCSTNDSNSTSGGVQSDEGQYYTFDFAVDGVLDINLTNMDAAGGKILYYDFGESCAEIFAKGTTSQLDAGFKSKVASIAVNAGTYTLGLLGKSSSNDTLYEIDVSFRSACPGGPPVYPTTYSSVGINEPGVDYDVDKNITTKIVNKPFGLHASYLNSSKEVDTYDGGSKSIPMVVIVAQADSATCTTKDVLGQGTILDGAEDTVITPLQIGAASKDDRIKITAFDYGKLLEDASGLNCGSSSLNSTLCLVPACFNNSQNILSVFPPAFQPGVMLCVFGDGGGAAPCQSNAYRGNCGGKKMTISPSKYDNDLGCAMCLADAVSGECSEDNFAIRPNDFNTTIVPNQIFLAGEAQTLTFEAEDFAGAPSSDYNENENTSFTVDIDISDSNKTCAEPSINFSPIVDFTNGTVTDNYTLNNVGDFNLTMHETIGAEFALVDADDTNETLRLIEPFTTQIKVIPHHFGLDGNLTNGADSKLFTYLSNFEQFETNESRNVSASLDLNVSAQRADNNITSNYTSLCYAKDGNLKLTLANAINKDNPETDSLTKLLWYHYTPDSNGSILLDGVTTEYQIPFYSTQFDSNDTNGTAEFNYKINFDRNRSKVVNPFIVIVNEINATDSDNVSGAKAGGNATFVYGRTHASRQRYQGPTGTANIYFESYCFGGGCNKTLLNGFSPNMQRTDDVRWYVNEAHTVTDDGFVGIVVEKIGTNVVGDIVDATDNPIGNPSVTTLNYSGSKGYPYKTTMQNEASPWLIYPTAPRNEFQVEFSNQGDWTGENETTTTTQDSNASITNRRIMW